MITSASADRRLAAVHDALGGHVAGRTTLLVAPSRAAADECAAVVAAARGGLFGVTRTSLIELIMKLALPRLAQQHVTPTSGVGLEAVVTRARFDAMQEGALRYFAPVADTPGFPRAAARTLDELQMAGVSPQALAAMDDAGADLATLLHRLQREAGKAGTVSRAGLWEAATVRLNEDPALELGAVVLLDVAITSRAEERFVAALVSRVPSATMTVPAGDRRTLAAVARLGYSIAAAGAVNPPQPRTPTRRGRKAVAPVPPPALARLQQHLFSPRTRPRATSTSRSRCSRRLARDAKPSKWRAG